MTRMVRPPPPLLHARPLRWLCLLCTGNIVVLPARIAAAPSTCVPIPAGGLVLSAPLAFVNINHNDHAFAKVRPCCERMFAYVCLGGGGAV